MMVIHGFIQRHRIILRIISLCLTAASLFFAIMWYYNKDGSYEPLVLILSILSALIGTPTLLDSLTSHKVTEKEVITHHEVHKETEKTLLSIKEEELPTPDWPTAIERGIRAFKTLHPNMEVRVNNTNVNQGVAYLRVQVSQHYIPFSGMDPRSIRSKFFYLSINGKGEIFRIKQSD